MKRFVTKDRLDIESSAEQFNCSLWLPIVGSWSSRPRDPLWEPKDLSILHIPGKETSQGSTQFITYEDDPQRAASYRTWRRIIRDLRIAIRNLNKSVGKDYFERLCRRFSVSYTKNTWTGEYRLDKHYYEKTSKWDAVWQFSLLEYYQWMLQVRNNDAKAKQWLNRNIQDLLLRQERGEALPMVTWVQGPQDPTPKFGHCIQPAGMAKRNQLSYQLVPKTIRKKVVGHNWEKIRSAFRARISFRDRKIAGYVKRLKQAQQQAAKYAFSAGQLGNNRCFQQSSSSAFNVPKVLSVSRLKFTNQLRGSSYIESLSGSFVPVVKWKAGPNEEIRARLTTYISDPDKGGDFSGVSLAALAEGGHLDGIYDPTTEVLRMLSKAGWQMHYSETASFEYDHDSFWKRMADIGFPSDAPKDRVMDSLVVGDAVGLECIQLDDVPTVVKWNVTTNKPVSQTPSGTLGPREDFRWETSKELLPNSVRVIEPNSDNFRAAFEEARLLNHKRLLALDIPEHDRKPEFNIARSVAELKDTPETVRTGVGFVKFITGHAEENFIEVWPTSSRSKRRLSLLTSGDPLVAEFVARYGPNPRIGSYRRFAASKRLSAVRVVAIRRALVPELAALYLAWKFGVSQTLADIKTVCKSGLSWAVDARRGLTEILARLDSAATDHVIGRSYRVLPDGSHDCVEKRAKREPNGLRPFREQDGFLDYTELPEVRNLSVSWEQGLRHYEIAGGMCSEYWQDRLSNGLPFIYDDNGYGLKMLGPDVAYHVEWLGGQSLARVLDELDRHNLDVLRRMIHEKEGIVRPTVVTAKSVAGRHWATWSTASLRKALRADKWYKLLADTEPLLVAWELLPASFVVEWFTNIRSLVHAASKDLQRIMGKIASPISKIWECYRIRLWAGCPDESFELSSEYQFRQPRLRLAVWQYEITSVDPESGVVQTKHCASFTLSSVYLTRMLYIHTSRSGFRGVQVQKTRIRRFYRMPAPGVAGKLPQFRARLSMTVGKLFSLAAMAVTR